uniref:OSIGBa0140A01.5 protein n=1 Tax=Oryza sativa TaxID=4530 RepID=Q01KT4_ORYSA|nr:OSIGBa0140A01.5 [Oryza sativa]
MDPLSPHSPVQRGHLSAASRHRKRADAWMEARRRLQHPPSQHDRHRCLDQTARVNGCLVASPSPPPPHRSHRLTVTTADGLHHRRSVAPCSRPLSPAVPRHPPPSSVEPPLRPPPRRGEGEEERVAEAALGFPPVSPARGRRGGEQFVLPGRL